jgi:hypothetical protein
VLALDETEAAPERASDARIRVGEAGVCIRNACFALEEEPVPGHRRLLPFVRCERVDGRAETLALTREEKY